MKKLLSGMIAAFLMAAGLVAFSGQSAHAACVSGSYVPCVATTVKPTAPKMVKAGKPAKVKVAVSTRGNVKASGSATVAVKGPGFSKTVKVKIVNGKVVTADLGKLVKPGKYKVTITFKGNDGYRDSKSTVTITVKKAKK